jgi:two-component sensor histidine kinase/CheY-like chemotaxis protein
MDGIARKTILLVEDELLEALRSGTQLEKHGYAVRAVRSAEEALEVVFGPEPPDLVALDFGAGAAVPGAAVGEAEGVATAKRILAKRRLPIVLLYAAAEAPRLADVRLPAVRFAAKSAGAAGLLEAVELAFAAVPAAAKPAAAGKSAAKPAPAPSAAPYAAAVAAPASAPAAGGDPIAALRAAYKQTRSALASIESRLEAAAALASAAPSGAAGPRAAVGPALDAFERTRSLRRLYDQILAERAFDRLSIRTYLEGVLDAVGPLYPATVALEKRLDDCTIASRRLFLVGAAVHELVANAMQHAFAGRPGGRIAVRAACRDGRVTVTVRDDGVGLPAGFDPARAAGSGLKLVRQAAAWLGGSFEVDGRAGASFDLAFPENG